MSKFEIIHMFDDVFNLSFIRVFYDLKVLN